MIAVKSDIAAKHVTRIIDHIEHIFITLAKGTSKILISVVYLPPQASWELYEYYCDAVENAVNNTNAQIVILLGDFNIPNVKWVNEGYGARADGNLSAQSRILSDLAAYLNLKQTNNIPNITGNYLDLIFANIDINVMPADQPLLPLDSYHPALSFELSVSGEPVESIDFDYEYYDFESANFNEINSFLGFFDWNQLVNSGTTNEAVNSFYDVIYTAFDLFIPKKRSRKPKFPSPWFDDALKELIFKKKIAHKKFKTTKSFNDYIVFSEFRKQCKALSGLCYKNYISNIQESITSNSKNFWKYIHSKNKSFGIPNVMYYDSESSLHGDEIANYFSNYFSSVYCNKKCDTYDVKVLQEVDISSCDISQIDIYNAIHKTSDSLSIGPDRIPIMFLKSCCYIVSSILCFIFNKSILEGEFPDAWKLSYVTPIHKSGDKSLVKNYRAVSKTSIIAKVFESVVDSKVKPHFQNILSDCQHGFIRGRSTVTNLLVYENELRNALETSKQVDVIYTDFSKAFDKVNHNLLIYKLERVGIFGNLLRWFRSYLSNRRQIVKIKGFTSDEIMVTSGVPQGSHLSPLLFNIFINDISDFLKHSKFLLYADDLKIYSIVESMEDCYKLQLDLESLKDWCQLNNMVLNIQKCQVMQFYRKKNFLTFNYKIDDVVLEGSNVVRDLGVYFDKNVSFNFHIEYTTNKAMKMLGFIKRSLSDFTDIKCFKVLYCSFVRSVLEYACPVWSPCYKTYVDLIERVQKKFLRFIGYKMGMTVEKIVYEEIMNLLNLPNLEDRRTITDICTLHKVLNSAIDCPELLEKIGLNTPQRTLRTTNLFHLPFHRTNYGLSSALTRLCAGANAINRISNIDLFSDNIQTTKNKARQVL